MRKADPTIEEMQECETIEEFIAKWFLRCGKKVKDFLMGCGLDLNTGTSNLVEKTFGNGGDITRDGSRLDQIFIIRIERKNGGATGAITGVKLDGYRKHRKKKHYSRAIPQTVHNFYYKKPCRWCGGKRNEKNAPVDHCDGRYNDPDFQIEETVDYQPLCSPCNSRKRELCKKCRQNKIRPDARKVMPGSIVGWHDGDKNYVGTCKGCCLYNFKYWRREESKTWKAKYQPDLLDTDRDETEMELADIQEGTLRCATT